MLKKFFRLITAIGGLAILWLRARFTANRAETAPRELKRILVLGYAAIGDCVFLLPALRCLRVLFPKARIVFMAPRYLTTEELVPATGLADEIWEFEASLAEQEKSRLGRKIQEGRFDAVIMSHATPARLFVPAILGIPIRVGHCRPLTAPHDGWSRARYALWRLRRGFISDEFERRLALNRKVWVAEDAEHTVSRNLRLVQALGLGLPPAAENPPSWPETSAQAAAAEQVLRGIQPSKAICVHVGSPNSQYDKIWPAEKWAGVCRKLTESYDARIIVLGGPDEKEAAARFVSALGLPCLNLAGRLRLMETLAVARRCRLMISSDTGLSKAAMAMGVPTASLWGPTDPRDFGVFWDREKHLEISRTLPCSPCARMGLRSEGAGVINFATCGHHACLKELTVEEVFSAVSAHYRSLAA